MSNFIAKKQVNSDYYEFKNYMSKERWCSIYHQIDEIISRKPDSVLEVGMGQGVTKNYVKSNFNIKYDTLDIDEELKPDFVGSILEMPFDDSQYDIVCSYQVLEHLPFALFHEALSELFRVAKQAVIISLPNAQKMFKFQITWVYKSRLYKCPFFRLKQLKPHDQHHWEINRKGFEINVVRKVLLDTAQKSGFALCKEYRDWDNPVHHFFIMEKLNN